MPQVNILVKAKDEASRIFGGINDNLFGFNSTLMKVGLVGAGALGAVGLAVGKLVMDEAQMEPMQLTFENLTESIGSTADAVLDELRPATMMMLNDDELVMAANKLLASGIADTAAEAANLAGTATRLGVAMGQEAGPSIEAFTNMLMMGSTRALKDFGISADDVTLRVKALQEADASLTDQQAFMQAVMEVSNETLARTGDISDTSAVKMAAMRTKMANLTDELAEGLLPLFTELLDELIIPLTDAIVTGLAPAMETTLPEAAKATIGALKGIGDLIGNILEAIRQLDAWTAAHLAAPELRGYPGRAEAGNYAGSYMGPSEGGRWQQRVEININGMPELSRYLVAEAITQVERPGT